MCNSSGAYGGSNMQMKPMSTGNAFGGAFGGNGFAADNTGVANGQSALGGLNSGLHQYRPPMPMQGNPFNQGGADWQSMQYGPPRGMGMGMGRGEGQFQPPPGMAQSMGPAEGRFQPPQGPLPPQGMREAAFNPQNYPGQPMSQAGVNPYNVVPMNSGLHPLQRPYYQGR